MAQLPPGWVPQRPTRDVGVDFVVVICEAGPLNGHEFRVQVKTSKQFRTKGDSLVIAGVKRSTIDYWFVSPVPTMVVAYDHGRGRGYYRWHNEFYEELSRIQSETKPRTISLNIPTRSPLVESAWEDVRQALLWHHRNLRASLRAARDAESLLPTIRELAAAVRQLNSIDHQQIPQVQRTQEQEGLLVLIEMIQHRNVVKATSRLLNEMDRGTDGADRLQAWIDEYRASVTSVFRTFDQFPEGDEIPSDFEFLYAPSLVPVVRPRLMEAALELIMLLTPGGDSDGETSGA
ncbi:DUF4365 domain-containing protein [Streptomyces sp. C10]|uniref:DUF4365 domain-containing protein n=1 Tax=Streptomyces sp. C10 TaxID=531941 RepID=UPI00397EBB81